MKIWDLLSWDCICRVHFMSDSSSSVWGHSVHFAKFDSSSRSCHRISTKLFYYGGGSREYRLHVFLFSAMCQIPNLNNLQHFEHMSPHPSATLPLAVFAHKPLLASSGKRSSRAKALEPLVHFQAVTCAISTIKINMTNYSKMGLVFEKA